ncbi:MAG TPA: nuclear transport factor 2 family protein [Terriglobales bacterium]|nr:nuclear transport factor 2 family protein [Terriglobales bacterium]
MFNKKIPQAISMVLLISALAGSEAAAQLVTNPASKKVEQEITSLLKEFLTKVDKVEMHDRFWAENLVYTSGMGVVRAKADIMKSMRESAAKSTDAGKAVDAATPAGKDAYDAEEIVVRSFGDVALLNFKLVHHAADGTTNNFRNSGTFMKRNGKWQVVNWQATKVAPPAAEKTEDKKTEEKK